MSAEYEKCLDIDENSNSLKIVVMGLPGTGKKTFVSALYSKWSDIRSKKPRRGETDGCLAFNRRELVAEIIETSTGRRLPFVHRLPTCDAFVLVYSMVCDDSFKSVSAVRDQIIQQKGYTIPIIFAANKMDMADGVERVTRVYRDLSVSCDWEHGHYEMSALSMMDVDRILAQIMKRITDRTPGHSDLRATGTPRLDRFRGIFNNMLK